MAGSCADNHPTNSNCAVERHSRAQLDSMITVAALASAGDRPLVLQRFGRTVSYNAQRNAVQVVGCQGEVVANIPLADDRSRRSAELQAVGHNE